MTPWSADVPLVNPQFVSSQVPGLGEVGSGAISPSLVMSGGVAYDGQTQWPQQGSSPSGLSSALPNISHQLSQWANNNNDPGTPFSDSELAYNTNLMMQLDEQPWQYGVQDRAPNTGGASAFAQQINPTNHMTFNLQPPQFGLRNDNHGNRNVNNFGHTEMAQQSVSMLVNLCTINEFLTFCFKQPMRRSLDPEPDFESMLNFSPQASPSGLPDFASPPPDMSRQNASMSPLSSGMGLSQPSMAAPTTAAPAAVQPGISRLVPAEGPTHGGIEVTVLGENFHPGMVCMFGAFPAVTVQSYGPTTLVCLLPPSPCSGTVPVRALGADGQPVPLGRGQQPAVFTYGDTTDRKL